MKNLTVALMEEEALAVEAEVEAAVEAAQVVKDLVQVQG